MLRKRRSWLPFADDARRGSVDSHMTRFVVDCGVVLRLASEEIDVRAEHELLAPSLLRRAECR